MCGYLCFVITLNVSLMRARRDCSNGTTFVAADERNPDLSRQVLECPSGLLSQAHSDLTKRPQEYREQPVVMPSGVT